MPAAASTAWDEGRRTLKANAEEQPANSRTSTVHAVASSASRKWPRVKDAAKKGFHPPPTKLDFLSSDTAAAAEHKMSRHPCRRAGDAGRFSAMSTNHSTPATFAHRESTAASKSQQ
ncbi:hypothetical protein HYFRA_00001982 [Hymenoscyphus fraxineus]|uniref:Uncharacterized protein n=1 Tax=Hymenoscyphus fraxineus TaxID=746836 RepID=A0A9N9PE96_9HELO|nr:hypothetical protein HYFRA_00001982 [Hymenoscyphus fraxineus]